MKNIGAEILGIVIALLIGYFWGRSSVKPAEPIKVVEVKYIKGDTIHDTICNPIPYEVKVPVDVPVFVYTDTAALFAVWQDYYLERKYNLDFSNDTLGVFKVDAVVNQNKLISSTSTIQPIIKTITEKEIVKENSAKVFIPWILVGTSADFKANKLQVGMDKKSKYMIGVSGIRLENSYNYIIDLGIKF